MTPQQYLESIGLGHLHISATNPPLASLADRIALRVQRPIGDPPEGEVWLWVDGQDVDGTSRFEAEANLNRLAREAEADAARYRAALAVLRGEAPQPEEVTP